jgi:4-hydroxy-tetrahydrodipicolinate synthase
MPTTNLISAIGTPLKSDETLHLEGLERLLDLQWCAGIDGVLIAGTMGLLQLLREPTYISLIEQSTRLCNGRGEILIGVGDAGFARTADRIAAVNRHRVDGVVVLSPYLVRFGQDELIDYYRELAVLSKAPLFLYDLPSLTGVKLEMATILELSNHPNIAGIKCSGDLKDAMELIAYVDEGFRVIVAKADQVDVLCQQGITDQLDGIFSLVPEWISAIAASADADDWLAAAEWQRKASGVLQLLREYGVFPAYSELMNIRGVPGLFAPKPFQLLNETQRESLRNDPLVKLLAGHDKLAKPTSVSMNGKLARASNNKGQPNETYQRD